MAAFTYTVGIMVHDLAHSLFIIGVLIAAFGSALTILEDEPFHEGQKKRMTRTRRENREEK